MTYSALSYAFYYNYSKCSIQVVHFSVVYTDFGMFLFERDQNVP